MRRAFSFRRIGVKQAAVMPSPVSVVIPARDECHTIGACLAALRRQTIGAERLDVIVVAAGNDGTAEAATHAGSAQFGRFDVIELADGDKNAALRVGCARAIGDPLILLDADTELSATAIAEFVRLLISEPRSVAHGAMVPRIDTWVARYSELNRKLVKQLHFDGHLSGEVIALPRAALNENDLTVLFPDAIGANCDAYLGRVLRQHGWCTRYAANAGATTLFPWTVRGLLASQLRNRRSAMMTLPLREAALQAAYSLMLWVALIAAIAVVPRSRILAMVCATPLVVHVGALAWRIASLRRSGYGSYWRAFPPYAVLDLTARGLKCWAFVERMLGRRPSSRFHGERPAAPLASNAPVSLTADRVKV